jgi:hypothetical protein
MIRCRESDPAGQRPCGRLRRTRLRFAVRAGLAPLRGWPALPGVAACDGSPAWSAWSSWPPLAASAAGAGLLCGSSAATSPAGRGPGALPGRRGGPGLAVTAGSAGRVAGPAGRVAGPAGRVAGPAARVAGSAGRVAGPAARAAGPAGVGEGRGAAAWLPGGAVRSGPARPGSARPGPGPPGLVPRAGGGAVLARDPGPGRPAATASSAAASCSGCGRDTSRARIAALTVTFIPGMAASPPSVARQSCAACAARPGCTVSSGPPHQGGGIRRWPGPARWCAAARGHRGRLSW